MSPKSTDARILARPDEGKNPVPAGRLTMPSLQGEGVVNKAETRDGERHQAAIARCPGTLQVRPDEIPSWC